MTISNPHVFVVARDNEGRPIEMIVQIGKRQWIATTIPWYVNAWKKFLELLKNEEGR